MVEIKEGHIIVGVIILPAIIAIIGVAAHSAGFQDGQHLGMEYLHKGLYECVTALEQVVCRKVP